MSGKSAPTFSFSQGAWDDRELIRAFDSAVNSYKRRKETPAAVSETPQPRTQSDPRPSKSRKADKVAADQHQSQQAPPDEGVVMVGTVVHMEPATVANGVTGNEQVIANMLQAHYWAGTVACGVAGCALTSRQGTGQACTQHRCRRRSDCAKALTRGCVIAVVPSGDGRRQLKRPPGREQGPIELAEIQSLSCEGSLQSASALLVARLPHCAAPELYQRMSGSNRLKRAAREFGKGKALRAEPEERQQPDEQRDFDADEIAEGVTKYVRADVPLKEQVVEFVAANRSV